MEIYFEKNEFRTAWRSFTAAAKTGGAFVPEELSNLEPDPTVESLLAALNTATAQALKRADGGVCPQPVRLSHDGHRWQVEYVSTLDSRVVLRQTHGFTLSVHPGPDSESWPYNPRCIAAAKVLDLRDRRRANALSVEHRVLDAVAAIPRDEEPFLRDAPEGVQIIIRGGDHVEATVACNRSRLHDAFVAAGYPCKWVSETGETLQGAV